MTETFDVAGPLQLRVALDYGSVRVVARPGSTATVDVRPAVAGRQQDVEAAQNVRVTQTGATLDVRGAASGWRRFVRPGGADVDIEVPEHSDVTVTTGYADVEVSGPAGDCAVRTTGGSLRVPGRKRTKYGATTVGRVTDGGRVESTHGSIRVRETSGATNLSAASGDLVVDRASGELTVRVTYGAVQVGELTAGSCAVSTSYGGVDVGIPTGTAAYLDVQSDHGSVRSELGRADEPAVGVERVTVHARSSYGAITIRRA